jgi:L-iditol 2-dehydrogenase
MTRLCRLAPAWRSILPSPASSANSACMGIPTCVKTCVLRVTVKVDGAQREYMAWPARCCFPIPDTFSDADGVVLEPLGIAIHAVDLAHMKPGMRVGVYGCGPIGLLTLQMARLAGAAEIYATDLYPHRLEAARPWARPRCSRLGWSKRAPRSWQPPAAEGWMWLSRLRVKTRRSIPPSDRPAGRPGSPDRYPLAKTAPAFTASIARRKGLTIVCHRGGLWD